MANIIIYPQGNVGNTDPHMVFDDGSSKLQFNVKNGFLSLSSSTISDGVNIGPQNVTVSGGNDNGTECLFSCWGCSNDK